MTKEYLKRLLDYKAENGGKFTHEDAAYDLCINGFDRSNQELAKKWNWGKTTVYKYKNILVMAARSAHLDFDDRELYAEKDKPKIADSESESKVITEYAEESRKNENDFEPSKESFSPTPPFQRNTPPPPIKKNTPKGVQKEKSPSPKIPLETPLGETQESASSLRLVVPSTDPAPSIAAEILENTHPFSVDQARVYFQSRLDSDETARRAGFDAGLLANSFFWHWEARSFTDGDGKLITEKTWRRRAGTWWQLKEKYNPESAKKKVNGGLDESRFIFK